MSQSRQLAAIMFTDIVGYTALMSRDERKAMQLLQKNREIQNSLAKKHQGELLKEIGDGTLLCFHGAFDAVQCAIEIQKTCKEVPELVLRIGIHLGDVFLKITMRSGTELMWPPELNPLPMPGESVSQNKFSK